LTSPADPSTNTPFSIALLHFQTIVHCLDNAARARVEEEARQKQIEKAKSMKAQFQAEEADRQARIRVTKECSSCHEDFVWYFPKGQNAETYVPVVTEGQLNVDDYCKECLALLCKHCKGAMCVTVDQVNQSLCATCMDITCTFCNQNIQKLHLLGVKVCQGCSSTRVCDCGQLVPAYNLQYKKCTTCNVCFTCGKALPTPSEQTIRTCNDCLLLFEEL
jgi:cytochrome c5